jgi:hypothetical protein
MTSHRSVSGRAACMKGIEFERDTARDGSESMKGGAPAFLLSISFFLRSRSSATSADE